MNYQQFLSACSEAWKTQGNSQTKDVKAAYECLCLCQKTPQMSLVQVAAAAWKIYKGSADIVGDNVETWEDRCRIAIKHFEKLGHEIYQVQVRDVNHQAFATLYTSQGEVGTVSFMGKKNSYNIW